jgi:2-methylcitrate dehydratase PrpD
VRAHEIASMSLTVHPGVLELMDRRSPASELQAKLSVYHAAACAIVYGTVGLRQFRPECIEDPVVVALRDRMNVTVDPRFGRDEARVTIGLSDGRTVQAHVKHAVGSVCNPLPDAVLEAKARELAQGVLSAAETDQLIECIWSLDRLEDAGVIARLAQGARPR